MCAQKTMCGYDHTPAALAISVTIKREIFIRLVSFSLFKTCQSSRYKCMMHETFC